MDTVFTKVIDLLHKAGQQGIEVVLNNSQLQLKFPQDNNIDNSLLQEIKDNKQAIIEFLSDENWKAKRVDNNYQKISRVEKDLTPKVPLSFSQERLWFIDQFEGSVQYHVPMVLRLKGNLNLDALSFTLKTILDRHEALRTVFYEQDGQPWQSVKDNEELKLTINDGQRFRQDAEGLQQFIDGLVSKPFDLSKDDMLRASLITLDEQEHVLVVTMHHIASDAWSMSIMVKEVVELYSAFLEGRNARLEPLEIQYSDYAIWQRNNLGGELLDKKIDYWKEKLEGLKPLQLPTDFIRPAAGSTRGGGTG